MRRLFLAGLLVTIGFIGAQGVAQAQTQTVPYDPGPSVVVAPPVQVGGIVVTRPTQVGGIVVTRQGSLAFTGSNHVDLYVGVGVALLLAGTALLIAAARRRRAEIAIDA